MNKEKTLFLIEVTENNDIFYKDWLDRGYHALRLFKRVCKPLRALRRVWLENNWPFSNIWYEGWFKGLNQYDMIILNMSYLTCYMPFVIAKRYPNIRIICWYWNTVDSKTLPIETNNKNIEYWSFDDKDCIQYKMHKNVQYYCAPQNIADKGANESDIYFVGRSKGRKDIIDEFKDKASKLNLKCDFNIIGDNSNDLIPYKQVQEKLCRTKAVLEINKKDQVGFTLRTLESLFFGIKLITDNKAIKELPMYNKENVFILNEDSYDNLYEFINKPYNHIVDKYKEDYELDTWFNNFEVR